MPTNILPPPPSTQKITDESFLPTPAYWKWFDRLRLALTQFLPSLGAGNQILGVNAAGTANEYKTLVDGIGIDITHAPGSITIAIGQMELGHLMAFAARH